MAFHLTKTDLAKATKLTVGMHIVTLTTVEDEYLNDKGTTVQKVEFETDKGVTQPYWFHATDMGNASIKEFVEAADDVKLGEADINFDPHDYIGKKVCISCSMGKDKNGKAQLNIDNFYSAKKVPF